MSRCCARGLSGAATGVTERLVLTRPGGYMIQLTGGQLDLDRFERLHAQGRRALSEQDPVTASAKLREALDLWRGPPLSDLAYESFAQPEIARLEELRLTVLEERIDADLALGQHAELVGELRCARGRPSPTRADPPPADACAVSLRAGRQRHSTRTATLGAPLSRNSGSSPDASFRRWSGRSSPRTLRSISSATAGRPPVVRVAVRSSGASGSSPSSPTASRTHSRTGPPSS